MQQPTFWKAQNQNSSDNMTSSIATMSIDYTEESVQNLHENIDQTLLERHYQKQVCISKNNSLESKHLQITKGDSVTMQLWLTSLQESKEMRSLNWKE